MISRAPGPPLSSSGSFGSGHSEGGLVRKGADAWLRKGSIFPYPPYHLVDPCGGWEWDFPRIPGLDLHYFSQTAMLLAIGQTERRVPW